MSFYFVLNAKDRRALDDGVCVCVFSVYRKLCVAFFVSVCVCM